MIMAIITTNIILTKIELNYLEKNPLNNPQRLLQGNTIGLGK
jgi:hypothetical protein